VREPPDKRRGGDAIYFMADVRLSAFSLLFMQSESFLSYQRDWRKATTILDGEERHAPCAVWPLAPTDSECKNHRRKGVR
jgi:hypothetical protein